MEEIRRITQETFSEASNEEIMNQISYLEKVIKNYASFPTRDGIIFAPLLSKDYVCRYKELILWKKAVEESL